MNKRFILTALIFTCLCVCLTVSASAQTATLTAEDYFNRGQEFFKQLEPDGAIANYTKAIELNPNYTEAYLKRGFIFIL
jgi:Tfp pilus assembly protein PilF